MHAGYPCPPVPALKPPPPVPPPSPGPTPPPLPLPTPVPFPEPIPLPLPGPFESLIPFESGSPQLFMLGLGSFSSGGPKTVGVIARRAFGFVTTFGGVNCVIANLGSLPRLAGSGSWAPPPPPPPAFFAPGGSLGKNGEIVVISTDELAFVVEGEGSTSSNGPMISTRIVTWTAKDSACTRVNCVFLDHSSGTATGLLVVFSGASFGGEIMSRRFCQKPANPAFQLISSSEFTGPRGAERKNSLKLSRRLSPNPGVLNTVGFTPFMFTGRSKRKSLTLEKKFRSSESATGDL